MKRGIKYTDEPMAFEEVPDFLPIPDKLVVRDDNVKVTIALSRNSLESFKSQAEKYHTAYQKIIRNLLDIYATQNRSEVAISRCGNI